MKFLVCFALFLAAVQAHVIAPGVTTYAAAVPSYTYGAAPVLRAAAPLASVYSAPAYSTYSAPAYSTYSAPAYTTYSSGVAGFAPSVYSAPAVYGAAPAVYSTLLKK